MVWDGDTVVNNECIIPIPKRRIKDLFVNSYRFKKGRRAHIISYEMNCGPVTSGLFVLHKCDYKPCINPKHLYLGTQKENIQDVLDRHGDSYRLIQSIARNKYINEHPEEKLRLSSIATNGGWNKGLPAWNRGKTHSEDQKAKLKAAWVRRKERAK